MKAMDEFLEADSDTQAAVLRLFRSYGKLSAQLADYAEKAAADAGLAGISHGELATRLKIETLKPNARLRDIMAATRELSRHKMLEEEVDETISRLRAENDAHGLLIDEAKIRANEAEKLAQRAAGAVERAEKKVADMEKQRDGAREREKSAIEAKKLAVESRSREFSVRIAAQRELLALRQESEAQRKALAADLQDTKLALNRATKAEKLAAERLAKAEKELQRQIRLAEQAKHAETSAKDEMRRLKSEKLAAGRSLNDALADLRELRRDRERLNTLVETLKAENERLSADLEAKQNAADPVKDAFER